VGAHLCATATPCVDAATWPVAHKCGPTRVSGPYAFQCLHPPASTEAGSFSMSWRKRPLPERNPCGSALVRDGHTVRRRCNVASRAQVRSHKGLGFVRSFTASTHPHQPKREVFLCLGESGHCRSGTPVGAHLCATARPCVDAATWPVAHKCAPTRVSHLRCFQPTRINSFNMRLNCAPYGGLSMPVPLNRAWRKIGFICENVRKPASP